MFQGKTVIVTGGTKGIGKTLAKSFFDEGANVIICGRNAAEVDSVSKEIDISGNRFYGVKADVSIQSDCSMLADIAVKKFGTIDILVNNAGTIGEANLFEDAHLDQFVNTVSTNLFGMVFCTQAVLPCMKGAGKGKIINFAGAGVGSKKTLPNFSAYYTSKSAVVGFTETVAGELGKYMIQVNCVSPGAINTNITDFVIREGREKVGDDMFERTLKQKEEGGDSITNVVTMVHYLASDSSNHLTGRLLSAKWDTEDLLTDVQKDGDIFRLRRIDNQLFYGK